MSAFVYRADGTPVWYVASGDRITLKFALVDAVGPYAAGHLTGSTANAAVGDYRTAEATFSILLDSSTSFFKLYIFTLNAFNRAEGAVWTYPKTGVPTGTGTYYVAHRTKSGAFVRTGPAIFKSTHVVEREAMDARAAAVNTPDLAPAGVVEAAKRLEALLKQR
jgi:hypothetical protein